jgi:hypothetical protein
VKSPISIAARLEKPDSWPEETQVVQTLEIFLVGSFEKFVEVHCLSQTDFSQPDPEPHWIFSVHE